MSQQFESIFAPYRVSWTKLMLSLTWRGWIGWVLSPGAILSSWSLAQTFSEWEWAKPPTARECKPLCTGAFQAAACIVVASHMVKPRLKSMKIDSASWLEELQTNYVKEHTYNRKNLYPFFCYEQDSRVVTEQRERDMNRWSSKSRIWAEWGSFIHY